MTSQNNPASPSHALKTKYAPALKDLFNEMNRLCELIGKSQSAENDQSDFWKNVEQVYKDFTRDGGTDEEWITLNNSVQRGDFDFCSPS